MADISDLRFPIGRFRMPASSAPDVRAAHIQVCLLYTSVIESPVGSTVNQPLIVEIPSTGEARVADKS